MFVLGVVELTLRALKLDMRIGLRPVLRVEVRLSEGGAPLFIEGRMRFQEGRLSIATEEGRPGLVEGYLVCLEAVCIWVKTIR